jgi:phosphate transport system permease protein
VRLQTRKLLDRTSSAVGLFSILLMASALVVLLGPIFARGIPAFLFRGTIEYRRLMLEQFERGDRYEIEREWSDARKARAPVYRLLAQFGSEISSMDGSSRRDYRAKLKELKEMVRTLFGPFPGE